MPLPAPTGEPPDVVTVRSVLHEVMAAIEREAEFSLRTIPDELVTQGILEFCIAAGRLNEALRVTVELLEEFPRVALVFLRTLAPRLDLQPVIPKEDRGKLVAAVETWLEWAVQHDYITERSHHFLSWIHVVRQVEETCDMLLVEWKTGHTREPGKLGELGRQYPSIVLIRVLTRWALNEGERQPREWHNLMTTMTGVSDPVASLRHAPITGEPDDPGFPLARWVEWYRRWRPVVAPLALWPPKDESKKE